MCPFRVFIAFFDVFAHNAIYYFFYECSWNTIFRCQPHPLLSCTTSLKSKVIFRETSIFRTNSIKKLWRVTSFIYLPRGRVLIFNISCWSNEIENFCILGKKDWPWWHAIPLSNLRRSDEVDVNIKRIGFKISFIHTRPLNHAISQKKEKKELD